jgi:hypothetical protein
MSNVYLKLNEARAKFHALKLEKTGHNKFAGYYYFELGDFLIPALRIFDEVGLCAVVSFDKELASMRIHDIESEDWITITSPLGSAALKGCHEIQNIGACETYCRRYLWVAALEIVEHDALDATTGKEAKEPAKKGEVKADFKANAPALIFAELSTEDKDYCDQIATRVKALMPNASQAIDLLDAEGMNSDLKAGVWSLLDSKIRAAIKKAQEPIAYQPTTKEMQE